MLGLSVIVTALDMWSEAFSSNCWLPCVCWLITVNVQFSNGEKADWHYVHWQGPEIGVIGGLSLFFKFLLSWLLFVFVKNIVLPSFPLKALMLPRVLWLLQKIPAPVPRFAARRDNELNRFIGLCPFTTEKYRKRPQFHSLQLEKRIEVKNTFLPSAKRGTGAGTSSDYGSWSRYLLIFHALQLELELGHRKSSWLPKKIYWI